jgi:predicted nucleic acid-binding protein
VKIVLLDANIVLDVLLDQKPHVLASAAVWALVETGQAKGALAAHAVTTAHYLLRKQLGATRATRVISAILSVFPVAPVDGSVLRDAIQLAFPDFEDAVTAAAAAHLGCDLIVTRDPRGFRHSGLLALTPEAAAVVLRS